MGLADELTGLRSDRFEIRRRIGEGGMGVVVEAYDRERDAVVALKTLHHVEPAALYRFKQEFRALSDVVHPNLVTLYELLGSADRWFFSMELVDGRDFLTYVRPPPRLLRHIDGVIHVDETVSALPSTPGDLGQPTAPLPPRSASAPTHGEAGLLAEDQPPTPYAPAVLPKLRPALLQLAQGIHALHESGHLHRDIKASNVLVTPQGRVVVLDFGVITELAGRRSTVDEQVLLGTPAYIAPEQLDPRAAPDPAADWYAFGVLLYQALTGYRPFTGAPELVLRAKQLYAPTAPDRLVPDLPCDLVDLCTALLLRDPRARPSEAEILRLLGGGAGACAAPAPAPRPSVETRTCDPDGALIVGRERERAVLWDAFEEAKHGQGGAVLIGGRSGMGKSVLAERFATEVQARGGALVLRGRCYERESVPFKALDSLVDAVNRHLLDLPRAERDKLLPGDTAALARAFPVMAGLAASNPVADEPAHPRPSLDQDVQRRAFHALHELFDKLARVQPLVLVLDDLQWGDSDSAPFFAEAFLRPRRALLFIAGYRSDQVETSPLLKRLFAAVGGDASMERVRRVTLEALTREDLVALARRLLGRRDTSADAAERIAEEAEGSPYFVHELVRHHGGTEKASATSTLDEVILDRTASLSAEAKRLLEVVCVAGRRIAQGVAIKAARLDAHAERALLELRTGHFVLTTGVRALDAVEPYHDRVREALVTSLPDTRQRDVHVALADVLDEVYDHRPEHLYALAHHYFYGRPTDRLARVFQVNHQAALTAARSYAFDHALLYMEHAEQIAAVAAIPLDARFRQQLAELSARAGRVDRAAHHFELALAEADAPLQRAELRAGLSKLAIGQLDSAAASEAARLGLVEVGQRPPRSGALPLLGALRSFLRGRGIARDPRQFGSATGAKRAEYATVCQLYSHVGMTAYFEMDSLLMLQTVMRQHEWCGLLGPSRELVDWLSLSSIIAAVRGKPDASRRLRDRAEQIAGELEDPLARARARQYQGIALHILGDPIEADRMLREVIEVHGAYLENLDFLTGVADFAWNALMRGHARDGWWAVSRGLQRAAVAAGGETRLAEGHTYRCYAGPLLALLGRADEGARHLTRFREFIEGTPNDRWRWSSWLAHKMLFLVQTDQLGDELEEAIRMHAALKLSPSRLPLQLRHGYVAIARARVMQLERATAGERRTSRAAVARALRTLRRAAGTHTTLNCHRLAIEGAALRLDGKRASARRALDAAAALAKQTNNVRVLADVAREREALGDEHARARDCEA